MIPALGEIKVAQLGWYPVWQELLDRSLGHMDQGWKGEPHLPAKALSQAVGHLLQQSLLLEQAGALTPSAG